MEKFKGVRVRVNHIHCWLLIGKILDLVIRVYFEFQICEIPGWQKYMRLCKTRILLVPGWNLNAYCGYNLEKLKIIRVYVKRVYIWSPIGRIAD